MAPSVGQQSSPDGLVGNGEIMDVDAMYSWIADLGAELGVDVAELDLQSILDLARDAAHEVQRPAAPVSTYLAGFAAGRAGATGAEAGDYCRQASALALSWAAPQ